MVERRALLEWQVDCGGVRMEKTLEKRARLLAGVLRNRESVCRLSTWVLPPARKDPIALDDEFVFGGLRPRELAWFEMQVGEEPILYVCRTGSHVDVGHWFSNGRIWALAGKRALILIACGKRPFVERTEFAWLGETIYNHQTGELALAPREGLTVKTLRMGPIAGLQFLSQIFSEQREKEHA